MNKRVSLQIMHTGASRIRYVAIGLGSLFLILYLLLLLTLKSASFQSFLASQAAGWLSEEVKAPVSVGSVDISPFFSVELRDVFIGDQKGDTIASIPVLSVFIRRFSYSEKRVDIGTISLHQPVIKAIRDANGINRYQFLKDYFASDTTQTDTTPGWQVSLLRFELNDASVTYTKLPVIPKEWGVHYSDLGITGLSLVADEFTQEADTFLFHLHELKAREKSGPVIEQFCGRIRLEPERLVVNGMYLQTPYSRIGMEEVALRFTSLDDFDMFEENVRLQAKVLPSKIDFRDVCFFSSYLRGLNESILIRGDFRGTIATLRGKNILLKIREHTRLYCDFSIDGLPDAENAFWHFDFHHLYTDMAELSRLPVPPFSGNNTLSLPSSALKFGNVHYKGKFSGFLTDFVAFGSFNTDQGDLGSDVSLKQSDDGKHMILKGRLWSQSITAGELAGLPGEIGNAGFSVTADGTIQNDGSYRMNLEGDISHLQYRKYEYRNLVLNGVVTDKTFDGELHADDPNVKLDFFGKVDFSEKLPVYDFRCSLQQCYFTRLHLFGKDSMARLSVEMSARLTGDEPDNINGQITMSGIRYRSSKNVLDANTIELESNQLEGEKEIILKSDIADATITGNFSFLTIADAAMVFLSDYFPSLQKKQPDPKFLKSLAEKPMYMDFDIYTGNINPVLNEFVPGLKLAANSRVKGHADFSQRQLDFEMMSEKTTYEDIVIKHIDFSGSAANRYFSAQGIVKDLQLGEDYSAKDITAGINGHTDTAFVELGWDRKDSLSLAGNVSGMLRFYRSGSNRPAFSFEASPSLLWLANSDWYLNEAVVSYADSAVAIEKFVLNHDDQYLYADGSIGKHSDLLNVTINNFNLNNLNVFLEKDGYTFQGIMNGEASINGILSSLKMDSDFEVDQLVINGEDLGRTVSEAKYNSAEERIELDGSMHRGVIKTLSYQGHVGTNGDLDLNVELNKVRMKIIEPFVEGILSEVRGDISGNISLKGTTKKPLAEGIIKIQKANFLIDYLQTRYNFTGDIRINDKAFDFTGLRLFDVNGNYADVSGTIQHTYFDDFKLALQVSPKNFMMLNTRPADNELFYGKAMATGIIDVTGTFDEINLKVTAKTDKDTRFFIPLSSGSEVSEYDFLTFVSGREQQTVAVEEKTSVTGINMDFNLTVTPDAEVQIIFDSKVGDIIRGMGNGNLRMFINSSGDFQLFGDYIIEEGDYLFTLQNIINKKFEIEKGGSIRWNGDPYEAQMDMKAKYKLKTSLFDLTGDSTGRVPVECVLSMKNNLMQPEMSFTINLPESDSKAQGIISNLPQDEINKQIISLLVMNRFVTPENMKGGVAENRSSGNALGVTSSELLSNQLSHWLSQISKDFDIGVNYRPGDEITADELEVALSTQILNDRVIVNGNVGVGGQQHNTSSQLLGDFEVEVKVNRSGKLRVKGFTRSNESIIYDTSPYRQGLGIFYREDFDSFPSLMKKYWDGMFRRKKVTVAETEMQGRGMLVVRNSKHEIRNSKHGLVHELAPIYTKTICPCIRAIRVNSWRKYT